jgi:hypothetical protein
VSRQRNAEFVANQNRHLMLVKDRLHNTWTSKLVSCLSKGLRAAGKGWSCEGSPDFNLFRLTKSHRLYILLTLLMKDAVRQVFWWSVSDLVEMVRHT